jgi:hypothetical protein
MTTVTPSPATWILRFKYNKTTVFLHVDPLQSIASVKENLLAALRQTNPDGIAGKPLPDSASEIVLGRPANYNDIEEGWERILESVDDPFGAEPVEGKGKGKEPAIAKGKEPARKSTTTSSLTTIKGCKLQDRLPVAFKWGKDIREYIPGEEDWDVQYLTYEDVYDEEQEPVESVEMSIR